MKKKLIVVVSLLIFLIIILTVARYKNSPPPLNVHIEDKTSLIPFNPKRDYSSAVLVNLDNDEEKEIFVSVIENSNLFFKKFEGKLVPLEITELEYPKSITVSVTPCDIDQDGRDEILIINTDSRSRIVNFKNGVWSDLLADEEKYKDIIKNLSNAFASACIDRKGDGKFGFAVVSENGLIQFLEMNNGSISDIAADIGLNKKAQSRSVLGVPGPSGQTNILVGNTKENFYFVNNRDGTFTERNFEFNHKDSKLETRGISLIDYNHDDIMDVIYGNQNGPLRILQQDHSGQFREVGPHNLENNTVVNTVVVEDFNLDGYEDIYLNNIRSENSLFMGQGESWKKFNLGEFSEKNMYGVSTLVSDLDNNGRFEIFNTHGDGELFPLSLFSFSTEGNWIKIKPRFKNGGVPRGAVVHLKTSKLKHTKAISSGSGRYAAYDDVLLFGLRKDETVEEVEVIMPSGRKKISGDKLKIFEINTIDL